MKNSEVKYIGGFVDEKVLQTLFETVYHWEYKSDVKDEIVIFASVFC